MTNLRKKYFERPYLSLLPFLLLYLLIVITQSPASMIGDESRYIQFANNLLNGFYSPPPPDVNLWNGPGFPLYLVPFMAAGLPLLVIRLFNAFLLYAALLLFNKTLSEFLVPRRSFLITVVFACYYMPLKSLPFILTETLTILLISLIALLATRYFAPEKKHNLSKYGIFIAIILAFIILTKVIFGMVSLVASGIFLMLFLLTKNKQYLRSTILLLCALALCIPYLVYTYSLTGKFFYWSNASGMSAYWMSNPVPGEYGNWHNDSLTSPPLDSASQRILRFNHEKDYHEIYRYKSIQRDDAFKEYAIRNVKEHPIKFFQNWLANWSRMLFNYPVSYVALHKGTILNMLANIPFLLVIIYSSILTIQTRQKLPFAFTFLFGFFLIYLFASSLLSAYDRMFYILAPVFGTWIAYSITFFRKRPV